MSPCPLRKFFFLNFLFLIQCEGSPLNSEVLKVLFHWNLFNVILCPKNNIFFSGTAQITLIRYSSLLTSKSIFSMFLITQRRWPKNTVFLPTEGMWTEKKIGKHDFQYKNFVFKDLMVNTNFTPAERIRTFFL